MTKKQQEQFIKDLSNSVRDKIVEYIKNNKVPEHWDDTELRWLLKDSFSQLAFNKRNNRYQDYNDTVITHNL